MAAKASLRAATWVGTASRQPPVQPAASHQSFPTTSAHYAHCTSLFLEKKSPFSSPQPLILDANFCSAESAHLISSTCIHYLWRQVAMQTSVGLPAMEEAPPEKQTSTQMGRQLQISNLTFEIGRFVIKQTLLLLPPSR